MSWSEYSRSDRQLVSGNSQGSSAQLKGLQLVSGWCLVGVTLLRPVRKVVFCRNGSTCTRIGPRQPQASTEP